MATDADTHELAAAYALDALDADERRAFEAHLDGCARCREEVASFAAAVVGLAGATGPEPPAGLKARILDAAAAETAAAAEPAGPAADGGSGAVVAVDAARRRRAAGLASAARPQVLIPAFAAAAAAAVALGIWGANVSDTLERERAARASAAGALAAFADPDARRATAQNASLVVNRGRGALSVARLAPAPEGKAYQAWVIPPGKAPIPAGLFVVTGGRAVIVLEPTVEPGAVVAITLEDAAGAAAPTSEPLLALQTTPA